MSAHQSSDESHSHQTGINLKNRYLALFLGWILPGLGHFYQGRRFKGVVFFCCILGTFFSGVCLGDGKSVHWSWKSDYRTYWYPAQFMTGIVALPAVLQTWRQNPADIRPDRGNLVLKEKISGKLEGTLLDARIGESEDLILNLDGSIELTPQGDSGGIGEHVSGRFTGMLEPIPNEPGPIQENTASELTILSLSEIDPSVFPSPHREIVAEVEGKTLSEPSLKISGVLRGEVLNSRRFADYYCAPLDDVGLDAAHGKLGKYFELGMMYTMIAGLLNVLAMWDAFEGPAYGSGEKSEE